MAAPLTSTKLSSGVVVVNVARANVLFLLLRAYRNWDFPKGMVEPRLVPVLHWARGMMRSQPAGRS